MATQTLRLNGRAGACAACGAPIPANQGALVQRARRWLVYHLTAPCVPADLAEAADEKLASLERASELGERVVVAVANGQAAFSIHPDVHLPYPRFERYRDTCRAEGARFSGGANVLSLEDAPALIAALRAEGFALDVAPELADESKRQAEEQDRLLAEARARADAIDAELAASGHALFPYQRLGVEWLASRRSGILGDDMGLGKTVQAIAATPDGAPVLVVCPGVAKGVWEREFKRFRPSFDVFVVKKGADWRLPRPGEVVIASYSLLPACRWESCGFAYLPRLDERAAGGAAPEGLVLIADEAHALKGKATSSAPGGKGAVQRAARFRALAHAAREAGGRTWLLTATPMLNRAPELRGLLTQGDLFRESFGSFKRFAAIMGGEQGRYGWTWDSGSMDEDACRDALQRVMLRRLKVEVLKELPSKAYKTVTVPLDGGAQRACNALERAMRARGVDIAEALSEARQHEDTGAAFEELARARAALAAAKAKFLPELIEPYENADEPVVVFSAHRAAIDALGDREGWAVITGSTPPEKRTEIEEAFQRGELRGIAGTIKAAGVAITLTRASNAIFLDLDYTPALNAQAEDRIYRIGQDRAVLITRLVADHAIDARVLELLTEKSEAIRKSVDAARRGAEEDAVVKIAPVEIEAQSAPLRPKQEVARSPEDAAELIERKRLLESLTPRERDLIEEVERRDGRVIRCRDEWEEIRAGEIERKRRERHAELLKPTPEQLAAEDRRGPETERERWIVRALAHLTAHDADHALIDNGVGFNKPDTYWGHRLNTLAQSQGLTPDEWCEAFSRLPKYQGQVGAMPRKGS